MGRERIPRDLLLLIEEKLKRRTEFLEQRKRQLFFEAIVEDLNGEKLHESDSKATGRLPLASAAFLLESKEKIWSCS